MSPVATSDAAFRGGACPTPEYTIAYTGNYTTSADASGTIELDALPGVDLRLSVKRQVIGVLGDQHLGDQRLGRDAALDDPRRRRGLKP
jgi:hypothetical protein